MNHKYSVAVIGGGASGLMCACYLASCGISDIAVVERNPRVGKKLLMTGNGRCNITNLSADASSYHSDDNEKLNRIFQSFGVPFTREFIENTLLIRLIDKDDLVYPGTFKSSTVLDGLRFYCEDHGVTFITDTMIDSLSVDKLSTNELDASFYVIAAGGASYPDTGSDGNSYKLINSLIRNNSAFEPLCPALVQLRSSDKDIRVLSGSRARVRVKLYIDRTAAAEEEGEILFTDYGVSGICIMQLSSIYNRKKMSGLREAYLSVDLLPDMPREAVRDEVRRRLDIPSGRSYADKLSGLIQNNIAEVICKRDRDIACELKDFRISISGSMDFDKAQVTSGGLKLSYLSDNLSLKDNDIFYVIGETVNVDGPCGGYNLQWAWSSAFAAADDIVRRIKAL